MAEMSPPADRAATTGILLLIVGMVCISINDMLVKRLSGDYPLHQIVFVRSAIGLLLNLVILQFEGGFGLLRTSRPVLHLVRALLIVVANLAYFTALAVLTLATSNALFFIAPMLITLLSIPLLGEKVGPRRILAVVVGFVGVLFIVLDAGAVGDVPPLALALPIVAALAYALMQILTRKLGASSTAAAMAIYIQATFLVVSLLFFAIAGDGRFAEGSENPSVDFALRAWVWPNSQDIWVFLAIGLLIGVISYTLSQAYRIADAATVAPFEYVALPMAVFWGIVVFGDWPAWSTVAGILLIAGSGIYVFMRERVRALPHSRPGRRA
ncbi:MAG: DMT family transporter [Pseudomonadota bacterium]